MNITKEKLIEFLKERVKEIDELKSLHRYNNDLTKWKTKTTRILKEVYGEDSSQYKDFNSISYGPGYISTSTPESAFDKAYQDGLDNAKSTLTGIIEEIEGFGIFEQKKEATQNPKQVINIHQNQSQTVNVAIENSLKYHLSGKQFEELTELLKETDQKTKSEKIGNFLKRVGETSLIEIIKSLLI